jgi:hypothetical protein
LFESEERLASEIGGLLETLRDAASGRYACIADRKGIQFQSTLEGGEPTAVRVRDFLEPLLPALFRIPESLAGEGPREDVFEAWPHDDFLLAFLNGRGALIVACADAQQARDCIEPGFLALADRLLRLRPAWRVDDTGNGLFFGRPRVDWILASRGSGD